MKNQLPLVASTLYLRPWAMIEAYRRAWQLHRTAEPASMTGLPAIGTRHQGDDDGPLDAGFRSVHRLAWHATAEH